MKDKIKSYAKINMSLRVIKRAKNGYHKIKSVMSLIDFYDEIIFEESEKIEVFMTPCVCDEKDNLCYKVANYMKQFSKNNKGIKIHINKSIPIGGGLGGGSSNAASVMLFLNKYWNINFGEKKLMEIGFLFGADIPYFIKGEQAVVCGFGEKVKRFKKNIVGDIVLVVPPFSLETKKVFQNIDMNNVKSRTNKNIRIFENIFNDLEGAADIVSCGEVKKIKDILSSVGKGKALMSGSGSTIIYYVASDENPQKIYNIIKKRLENCEVILTKIKKEIPCEKC